MSEQRCFPNSKTPSPGPHRRARASWAFTLAELLIALAILGVIATFTIPKILQSQQDGRNKALVKEAAATLSAAYQNYKLKNSVSASTDALSILNSSLNYVKIDSSNVTQIDHMPLYGPVTCWVGEPCYFLANGAVIWTNGGQTFGGTATTNALVFMVDPDGKVTGAPGDAGKAVDLDLYFNGKILDRENSLPNSANTVWTWGPTPGADPTWFSWN